MTGEVWGRRRKRRGGRRMPLWQEIPLLLIIALGLAVLVRTFFFQAFFIPSGSMEDTLRRDDRVIVNKLSYEFGDPERGDVIVFKGPDNWVPENAVDPNSSFFTRLGRGLGDLVGISQPGEKDFIKRVIGLPGDHVSCCDVKGRIYVNGIPIDEPYVTSTKDANLDTAKTPGRCGPRAFDEVTVEPGMLFVMGDHRLVSQDSRCQGQVPIENVIGPAFSIVWPVSRWNGLDVGDTFSKVPDGRANASGQVSPGDPAPLGALLAGAAVMLPWATARRVRALKGESRRLRP
nr:signal peptidase I [Allocatelliglobosispora scoriae]